jgi:hypothetical protein
MNDIRRFDESLYNYNIKMKFKTIILIILAIFFLGIVIYDFVVTKKILEGLGTLTEDEKKDANIESATSYIRNRIRPNNLSGISDTLILENIKKIGLLGNETLNLSIYEIINHTNHTDKQKVDKLEEIFGIPQYDPLQDSLEIWYDFDEVYTEKAEAPKILNKSKNPDNPSIYDAKIMLLGTTQDITNILDAPVVPIIKGKKSVLNLLGRGQKNDGTGAYLLLNTIPTFYSKNFLGMTISLWFKVTNTLEQRWSRLIDWANGTSDVIIITHSIHAWSGNLGFFISNGGTWNYLSIPYVYVLNNKWIHLVWTIDTKGVWKIYLNNELMIDEKQAIPPNIIRRTCFFGASNWWWDFLTYGNMADFRCYQRTITQDEVNLIYNLGNITDYLPIRKNPNLIQNGTFSMPRTDQLTTGQSASWWSGSSGLISNYPDRSDYTKVPVPIELGYYSKHNYLAYSEKPLNYLEQTNIFVEPNVTYEFSFIYILRMQHTENIVFIIVKLGCYIDAGADKSIVPVRNEWRKYTVQFTTDKDCIAETLKIHLESKYPGHPGGYECLVNGFSLRKV